MQDEMNGKSGKLYFYNNNDLVIHFKALHWNVLIYGFDKVMKWIFDPRDSVN